jgi:hypothetical protein
MRRASQRKGAKEQSEWESAGKRGKGAKRLEKADWSRAHPIQIRGAYLGNDDVPNRRSRCR